MYEEIKKHLKENIKVRERRNKNLFIAWLLSKKYGDNNVIPFTKIEDLIVDAASYDRAWRKVLQDCPHLRGSDYVEKEVLEQEKQIQLGYEPGYNMKLKI